MALPGHSPPHLFSGPGSPPRALNGHNDTHMPPTMYGPPRTMLPPSPQHYQHRFPNPSIPTPSPSLPSLQDPRGPPPPYKRPGSSMSISSMLGGEPERAPHDPYQSRISRMPSHQASTSAPSMTLTNVMSPPQQPSKPVYLDYPYKRARTPDRMGASYDMGPTRQRSSSSGTTLQRPTPFMETHHRSSSTAPPTRYNEQMSMSQFGATPNGHQEQEERARRTSLSGILQRPNSQPQSGSHISQPLNHPGSQAVAPIPFEHIPRPEPPKQNGTSGLYDTRPPGLNLNKIPITHHPSPPRSSPHSQSPELRRPSLNGSHGRGLAGLLNGPTSQPADQQGMATHMARQNSSQSQGDRSIFGERGKSRAYSPFASSFTSGSVAGNTQGRKGSDELSQHRAILGLASETKRGRFSPMPQAVQGAQAQTPVPDAGIKTEHGRVFSGIGSGISTTPTPGGHSSSPLKKDDGPLKLSEDNLKTFSRNTPATNKRSRKVREEDVRTESDAVNGEKSNTGGRKKGKHQHNYKADLEEMANSGFPRRNTPLSGLNPVRRTATPANAGNSNSQGYTHHTHKESIPAFKPKKVIKVGTVFASASQNPRRHLGNFIYRPSVRQLDSSKSNQPKFDISITPNLMPSFTDAEHVNCTYTIHVPRMWLQTRERALICAEQYLWGSGIYTDDSDPLAASMHAGFLKASLGDSVDTVLLSKVVQDQNPKIEFPRDLKMPEQPRDVESDKDLNITLVVLPLLEKYEDSVRFGVRSRAWPDKSDKVQHDGVSFAVLNVDFVNVGVEEIRVGRTGKGRRERLRMDLEARRKGLELQKQRIERAKKRQIEILKKKASTGHSGATPRSVPTNMGLSETRRVNGTGDVMKQQSTQMALAVA